ncbi:MAG: excinuclease ABC subunit C [Nitrospirae bacterium GWC2_46_6]|nr:MAG: excinuclease ABC subunit C [Nitrospirae bacterium GWC2_46_6]
MLPELSNTPLKPGVYIFKDRKERILYIGKAKNLRNRLRSYFQKSADLDQRKAAMVKMVKDFSYIVTDNELEALILEANLIKQHKPKFNIILRDDKNYPYIRITIKEEWPRIEVIRRIQKDGNLYFGPYVPAQAMWEALSFIRKNFLIRTCRYALDKPMRPCVQYQMKRCPAPCAGLISRKEYMKIIKEVILFLKGEKKELAAKLEDTMQRLSDEMKFEEAAMIRDRIIRLRKAFELQKVVSPELGDIDVIGYYREGDNLAFNILFVRGGVLIGAKDFFLDKIIASDESEIMHGFIEIFYAKEIIPPEIILVNAMPDDAKALKKWLKNRRGAKIAIEAPKDGKKLELLNMANENARLHFHQKNKPAKDDILPLIKNILHLKIVPKSIGAFDVSTIQGSESVGAFIYWEADGFNKDMYRHLRIKGVQGVDDYAMMHEIVGRVLSKEHLVPDLVVIDGGKGQLEVARSVMDDLGINTELISIAKKPDRAFLLNGEIVDLEDRSKESLLLKKIRDEVHRFAISFHRKLRDKRLMESPLEKIPGIGKKRRLELLRHFGSIENIRKASADDIAKIKGFNRKVAEMVVEGVRKG